MADGTIITAKKLVHKVDPGIYVTYCGLRDPNVKITMSAKFITCPVCRDKLVAIKARKKVRRRKWR